MSEFEKYAHGGYSSQELSLLEKNNNVPDYVVLEGNVGSGKSTAAILFGQAYGYSHLGEYGNYINFRGCEQFPDFPPKDTLSIISTNPLWLKIEFRRRKHLIDSAIEINKNPLLVERSPLSLVAFEYAKMKQKIPHEVTNLLGNYSMFSDVELFKEPVKYVFLNTIPETVRKRIIERGGRSIGFLYDSNTCLQIEHFFDFFKKGYLTSDQFLDIQTDSSLPEQIIKKIKILLDEPVLQTENTSFRKFCNDILCEKIELESI